LISVESKATILIQGLHLLHVPLVVLDNLQAQVPLVEVFKDFQNVILLDIIL